jgi:nitrate reductase NapE component
MKRADQRGERHEEHETDAPGMCRRCRDLWARFVNTPSAATADWYCMECERSCKASKEADPPESAWSTFAALAAVVVPFLALAFVAWVVFART